MNLDEITTGPFTSLSDLIDLEESLYSPDMPGEYWAFRGQPQAYGTLAPSFQRIFTQKRSVGAAEIIERDLMKTFRKHYAKLPGRTPDMPEHEEISESYNLRCLSVMQHYGVPTRLLDWTHDFWIAIYFACAGHPTDDAELWYYNRSIFFENESESELAAFVVSRDGYGTSAVGDKEEAGQLFEPPILFERGSNVLAELDIRLTPRMREQAAHHTVCSDVLADHGPLLRKLDTSGNLFRRVLVANSCKEKALRFLEEQKGKTASTIFPDVEGLGRFLHWHLETLVTTIL
jgi:hypothetical protein